MLTTNELCRVSIRFSNSEIDLSLPFDVPICELLPTIVDLITAEDDEPRSALCGRGVSLGRAGGAGLDPAMSLAQCHIDDGALLVLTAESIPPPEYRFDVCAEVRETVRSVSRPWTLAANRAAAILLLVWFVLAELIILGMPLADMHAPRHWVFSAAVAVVAAVAAIAIQRVGRSGTATVVLAVLATAFSAMASALAVPGRPGVVHFLLMLSACSAAAIGLARLLHCGTEVLVPIAGIAATAAGITLGTALHCWPVSAVGPILVAGWLMVLTMSPRLATRAAGLSPADPANGELSARAATAHDGLTRMVVISAIAVAFGVIITAVTSPRSPAAQALVGAAAAALMLHIRRHTEKRRVAALMVGAGVSATVLIALLAVGRPNWAPWFCACLGVLVAVCGWFLTDTPRQQSAMIRQTVDIIEFTVTAAVIPITCWAAGLFATVRGLSVA